MHLADLQLLSRGGRKTCRAIRDPDAWAHKAVLNVAASGRFSSDRTIAEYAAEIWHAQACPVPIGPVP